jgi:hypothetical protein
MVSTELGASLSNGAAVAAPAAGGQVVIAEVSGIEFIGCRSLGTLRRRPAASAAWPRRAVLSRTGCR